jgi:hypothetical protein
MGTKLDFSIAYHPQSDGQTERVNKVLEDLLRACVLTFDRNWESSLPYWSLNEQDLTERYSGKWSESPKISQDHHRDNIIVS